MNQALIPELRVIDMAEGKLETAGRFLADLGADVVRVEPTEGAPSRRRGPMVANTSIDYAVRNTNKRGVTCNLSEPEGRERLWSLLESADLWIETEPPGALARQGFAIEEVRRRIPRLVILSVSEFGHTGPYRDYVATSLVHLALGTQLSRSGRPGREPLMLPGRMAYETAALQAAFAGLVGYLQQLKTGVGGHIDFSIWEATLQIIDPPFGTIGTAAVGNTAAMLALAERGRPTANRYPVLACADGHVRLSVLAPRQWRSLRRWIGEPEEFQDPKYDLIHERITAQSRLYRLYAEFFRDKTMADLTAQGQSYGVPIAPVLTPAEVMVEPHFANRGAFMDAELAPGVWARIPAGFVEVDGRRLGFRYRAPCLGEHDAEIFGAGASSESAQESLQPPHADPSNQRPLAGIRVLDFGVIVFGAEVGRLLADMGAEVIKIESQQFPDGSRTVIGPDAPPISPSFAIGHRNQKSFGVALRSADGVDVFKQLVALSDVVLSNFKPGTLEKLGVGYEDLAAINPRLVWMSASGLGHTGPWRNWLAYGPLVRSSAGLTSLWRYPDDPDSFSDQTTVHPDHFAARVAATTVVAALLRRRRTGAGADIRVSQAEAVINQLAELYARESLSPGCATAEENGSVGGAPWGVYPCAGDDEWCVITVRDDADWRRFSHAIGDPPWCQAADLTTAERRVANRPGLDARVADWTSGLSAKQVMELLQRSQVPAAAMLRATDLADDPQLVARRFTVEFDQPGLRTSIIAERRPFSATHVPEPPLGAAPEPGQQTREICRELLGMGAEEIDDLIRARVLEVPEPLSVNEA